MYYCTSDVLAVPRRDFDQQRPLLGGKLVLVRISLGLGVGGRTCSSRGSFLTQRKVIVATLSNLKCFNKERKKKEKKK